MDAFFFRVEHDLLKSRAFKDLGGSAIKVYLTIGLYSDFGTGWAYPSIRTIAKQAGLSRQTVLSAIEELARAGLLATSKSRGRSTAYQIVRQAPDRPARGKAAKARDTSGPDSWTPDLGSVLESFTPGGSAVPESFTAAAQLLGPGGRGDRPKREPGTREEPASLPIPGTPFRVTAEGRLLVTVDLQELLTDQGLPRQLAGRLANRRDPEEVAKVLLNALYLKSQGKLQNEVGYIRAGLEDGYELLPQVASRLESRRKELIERLRQVDRRREESRREAEQEAEEEAVRMLIESLRPDHLEGLVSQAVASLPSPLVRRNPTLSNPFVRARVYELAGGEPAED